MNSAHSDGLARSSAFHVVDNDRNSVADGTVLFSRGVSSAVRRAALRLILIFKAVKYEVHF